jgi:hypothetical protein
VFGIQVENLEPRSFQGIRVGIRTLGS